MYEQPSPKQKVKYDSVREYERAEYAAVQDGSGNAAGAAASSSRDVGNSDTRDYENVITAGSGRGGSAEPGAAYAELNQCNSSAGEHKYGAVIARGEAHYANVADDNDLSAEEKYETIGKAFAGFGAVDDDDDGKYATLDKNGGDEDTYC